VVEEPARSLAIAAHAEYLVRNDFPDAMHPDAHDEDPLAPFYSPEGDDAAMKSALVTGFVAGTDVEAMRGWMTAPFHGVGLIDPRLDTTGFGTFADGMGATRWAAGLWTDTGMVFVPPPGTTFPIVWPGDGTEIDVLQYDGNEFPQPVSHCEGAGWPIPPRGMAHAIRFGTPIYVLYGDGSVTPAVAGSTLTRRSDMALLDHCRFDETDYVNTVDDATGAAEALGRAILGFRDCVVIVPRDPLTPGETYDVTITEATFGTTAWSFSVDPSAVP
jgi:hypothetical protein